MINNVFEFNDKGASEVMKHRTDVFAVDINSDINEYGKGIEEINVYLTYYNYSDYYHPKDF